VVLSNTDNPTCKIAAIDFGMKSNIYDIMLEHDAEVEIFPANISHDEILASNPDGVFLSWTWRPCCCDIWNRNGKKFVR